MMTLRTTQNPGEKKAIYSVNRSNEIPTNLGSVDFFCAANRFSYLRAILASKGQVRLDLRSKDIDRVS